MAYVARPSDFHGAQAYRAPIPTPARPAPGLWRRLIDRLLDARQRDADDAVAQYVARRGKLTDSMEREIADRFMTGSWGPRQ